MEFDETNIPMESDETNSPWNQMKQLTSWNLMKEIAPWILMKQPSVEIIQSSHFPPLWENYVLPCRVETHLEFHGFPLAFFTDAPGILNVQFERTEVGFFYKQNHSLITPHVTKDGIVPFEAMRDYILPEINSHYHELTMKYYDTILYVWSYIQTFWTMKQRSHWKLDSYLQMKPLRHSPDKKSLPA
ncbi:hypothetical protein TNCV_5024581 [Trichonephila clavipes]|nr:hypothetical protein TNCV_5024581 [Trichonephila clavipes]